MDIAPAGMLVSTVAMKGVKIVSFDAEGTMVTTEFSHAIWHEAIPKLCAATRGLDLSDARQLVYEEYDRVGQHRLEWYDIEYWFNYLGLGDPEPVIRSCLGAIAHYPEVTEVLTALATEYRLVVSSCTPREMLHFLLQDIEPYFVRVFSAVSHFKQLKNPDFYLWICREMGVSPEQVIHIGDNWEFDFINSGLAGMNAFHLDRSATREEQSLESLTQLADLLLSPR